MPPYRVMISKLRAYNKTFDKYWTDLEDNVFSLDVSGVKLVSHCTVWRIMFFASNAFCNAKAVLFILNTLQTSYFLHAKGSTDALKRYDPYYVCHTTRFATDELRHLTRRYDQWQILQMCFRCVS